MASKSKRQKSSETYRMMYGSCPDDGCQAKLYFPSYDKSIECTNCGQRHERSALKSVAEVTNSGVAVHNLLKNILLGNVKPKKGADNVKVLGLSNYVCKLISPILTYYGMDRESGKAKRLVNMGKGEIFDVNILGDRAFVIEEENLGVNGYGRDRSGSILYLADTLSDIKMANDNKENLVPIHADGDGHCLVHAISRSLVGRELFWHALRINLKSHLIDNLGKYKLLFKDFVDQDEWDDIVDECDPYYLPPEGEALGMRNIHIFGLANVLHRPIILLDSKSGMNSSGDYSGVFLPGLVSPEKCKGKDGSLNKPLVIAWSSYGRNHYIPLVPVKGLGPAKLPKFMVQKAWGMPRETISDYLEFDSQYCCTVGGGKCLTDGYLRQLVRTMEKIFIERYDVCPSLVADVHQFIYKSAGIVGMLPNEVIERTQTSVADKKLFRCLMCEALTEYALSKEQFNKGGSLYKLAISIHKKLDPTKLYSFPTEGAVCSYDNKSDCLVLDVGRSRPKTCAFCQGDTLRQVKADGTVLYIDGDRTTTPCIGGKCPCGFKHFWNGKEYDNIPEIFPIALQWGGKTITEKIPWFQYESDSALNSNVFEVAQALVQKHFPGEFGSERLVQRVVDSILNQSAISWKKTNVDSVMGDSNKDPVFDNSIDTWSAETASKIILTGPKKKTIHKEELMMSEKEKTLRKQIVSNAPKIQQKKTQELADKKFPQRSIGQMLSENKGVLSKSSHAKVPTNEPTPGTSTGPTINPSSATQKVRLQTSDGRQVMLTLVKEMTYSQLQKLIADTVDVPPARQKIRLGFPPKVLEQKKTGEEEAPLDIHHGDRLALEVLPDPEMVQSYPPAASSKHIASWSSFDEETQDQNAERLLQALKDIQRSGDSIDASIASLRIISELAGKDLWTYVQGMPHLFSVGGLLYNQVKRDLGLLEGKHCQLPCLPGKVFRYNSSEDRLELCLEPYGHFPMEPNIEQKVKESGLQAEATTSREDVKFGSSGAIHHEHERKAFSGQGHSLKTADDRMPPDLACDNHKPQARGFQDLCPVPGQQKDSIPEENEESMGDKDIEREDGNYQRLGPGYSVIDPGTVNSHNASLEMFRALAESIEKTLSENMEQNIDGGRPDITDDEQLTNNSNNADISKTNTDEITDIETHHTTTKSIFENITEQSQTYSKMDVVIEAGDVEQQEGDETVVIDSGLAKKTGAIDPGDVDEMDTEIGVDGSKKFVDDDVKLVLDDICIESIGDNNAEVDMVMNSETPETVKEIIKDKIVQQPHCDPKETEHEGVKMLDGEINVHNMTIDNDKENVEKTDKLVTIDTDMHISVEVNRVACDNNPIDTVKDCVSVYTSFNSEPDVNIMDTKDTTGDKLT